MVFDLVDDPHEVHDRGRDPAAAAVRAELEDRLDAWAWDMRRPAESVASIERRTDNQTERGFLLGFWSEAELA
jgi:hypothetical protein